MSVWLDHKGSQEKPERVELVWNAGAESGKQDNEAIEKEGEEEDIFCSVFSLEDMPLIQSQDPELAEIITYLSTGDLPMSDKAARKILMIEDQFTLDDGVLWHLLLNQDTQKEVLYQFDNYVYLRSLN